MARFKHWLRFLGRVFILYGTVALITGVGVLLSVTIYAHPALLAGIVIGASAAVATRVLMRTDLATRFMAVLTSTGHFHGV